MDGRVTADLIRSDSHIGRKPALVAIERSLNSNWCIANSPISKAGCLERIEIPANDISTSTPLNSTGEPIDAIDTRMENPITVNTPPPIGFSQPSPRLLIGPGRPSVNTAGNETHCHESSWRREPAAPLDAGAALFGHSDNTEPAMRDQASRPRLSPTGSLEADPQLNQSAGIVSLQPRSRTGPAPRSPTASDTRRSYDCGSG